jgi:hypothetical protein
MSRRPARLLVTGLLLVAAHLASGVASAQVAAPPDAAPQDGSVPAVAAPQDGQRPWWQRLDAGYSLRPAYWSSDRNAEDQRDFSAGSIWLRAQPRLSQSWTAKVEGWVQGQSFQGGGSHREELREAYASVASDDLELRVGRQIVVWGRADQLNPTDNLSSRDFTLLFPELDETRRGNGMVRLTRPFGGYTFSAYWLPEFRPNMVPTGALPPGVSFAKDEKPEQYDQVAFKLDRSGGAIDWSVSYFDGLDRNPDVAVQSAGPGGTILQQRYHRIHVIGADFATVAGRFGFRGEAAYTNTADANGSDPEIKNPFFYMVLGVDRTYFEYLNVNVQAVFRATAGYRNPRDTANPGLRSVAIQNAVFSGQLTPTQTGMSTRIGYKWLNETLEADVTGVGYFEKGDSLVRVKLLYHWTDLLRVTVGQETYAGPTDSFFGQQRKNSATFAELAYGY